MKKLLTGSPAKKSWSSSPEHRTSSRNRELSNMSRDWQRAGFKPVFSPIEHLMENPFYDRKEAGEVLAGELQHYSDWREVIVLALPRGGVAVGLEVARELHAPLDVFGVRKLGRR